jgi:RimJ/RimL family protein N-acetyltransferase
VIFPPLLQTPRLLIRPADPGAARLVNDAIRESYDSLHAWLPWADHVPSVDETREHLTRALAAFRDGSDHGLSIWERDGGVFAGAVGLHARLPDPRRQEIGYWLRAGARGRGYASEAVAAVAAAAFEALGLAAIEIHASARNVASHRVAVRAGFDLVAIRDDGRVDRDGIRSPTHVYARRRDGGD